MLGAVSVQRFPSALTEAPGLVLEGLRHHPCGKDNAQIKACLDRRPDAIIPQDLSRNSEMLKSNNILLRGVEHQLSGRNQAYQTNPSGACKVGWQKYVARPHLVV